MAKLTNNAPRVRAELGAGQVEGLALAAEHLLQVSRGRAPLEEGTLERSGVASVDPEGRRAAVSFDTPYAVRQHEDLDLHHDAGRTAKYLEGPAAEQRQTLLELIARGTSQAFG
jgi:hypothetical protein